jgi:Arc/MetJ family transcription regulator
MYQDICMKTSIDIDRRLSNAAAEALGTRTLKETVNAALEEVVRSRRRGELSEALRKGELTVPTTEEVARAKEPELPIGALDWLLSDR